MNWIKLFLKFKGNNNEKEKILTLAKQMKKSYNDGFIAKLLMSFTIFIIKFFNNFNINQYKPNMK